MIIVLIVINSMISLIGGIGIYANQQLANSFEDLEKFEIMVDAAAEASSYAKRAEGHLFLYLTLKDEIDKEKFFIRQTLLDDQIQILEDGIESFQSLEQIDSLKSFSAGILDYGTVLIELFDQNPDTFNFVEQTELIKNLHDSSSGARKTGVEIVKLETTHLNGQIEMSQNQAMDLQRGMGIIMGLLIIVTLSIGFMIVRSISKPIDKLGRIAQEIGKGRLGLQSNLSLRNEFGELVSTFNQMSSQLKINQEKLLEREREAATRTANWVGHDLRNPLQSIQNAVYSISKQSSKLSGSSDIHQKIDFLLKNIDDSVGYANRIIRNLKDFGSDNKPEFIQIDLNKFINEILSKVDTPRDIEIIEDFQQIPEVIIDERMMERVFMNLTINAIQAMNEGGKLNVATKKTKEFVEISFKDTGTGMTKETLEKIFDPFFTTKPKGMGVGLSICKKFIEKNGGSISVESEVGKGTIFVIKLPIK